LGRILNNMTLGQEAFADNQSNAVPAAQNTCTG
jgi:hypothetical protein